jgi:TPR repeat protein
MKLFLQVVLFSCCAGVALAQTPLREQAVVKTDPCADATAEDLGSCGLGAFGDHDYSAALRAWALAAQNGDYQSAIWLAQMYHGGKGVKKDDTQSYAWYDIAAALHAREIARELPAPATSARDSNQAEIDDRNTIGKKMTAAQIKQAQQISRNWQQVNPHAGEQAVSSAG